MTAGKQQCGKAKVGRSGNAPWCHGFPWGRARKMRNLVREMEKAAVLQVNSSGWHGMNWKFGLARIELPWK